MHGPIFLLNNCAHMLGTWLAIKYWSPIQVSLSSVLWCLFPMTAQYYQHRFHCGISTGAGRLVVWAFASWVRFPRRQILIFFCLSGYLLCEGKFMLSKFNCNTLGWKSCFFHMSAMSIEIFFILKTLVALLHYTTSIHRQKILKKYEMPGGSEKLISIWQHPVATPRKRDR